MILQEAKLVNNSDGFKTELHDIAFMKFYLR